MDKVNANAASLIKNETEMISEKLGWTKEIRELLVKAVRDKINSTMYNKSKNMAFIIAWKKKQQQETQIGSGYFVQYLN